MTDRPAEIIAGGSLSQLAALDIALDATLALRPDQIVCYAIAAPRTGNHEFAKAYDAAVPHTWNVINDQASEAVGPILYETLCKGYTLDCTLAASHIEEGVLGFKFVSCELLFKADCLRMLQMTVRK